MFLPFVSLPSANITTSASITFCWHSIRMMRRFACHVSLRFPPPVHSGLFLVSMCGCGFSLLCATPANRIWNRIGIHERDHPDLTNGCTEVLGFWHFSTRNENITY